MPAIQYYTLTILRVDINNVLTGAQNGDVGAVAQCP